MNRGTNRLARYSFICGVASIATSIICFVYPIFGILFGSLGITFALLSRDKRGHLEQAALIGLLCSLGGMFFNLCYIALIALFLSIPGNLQKILEQMDAMYSETWGESIYDSFKTIYGIDLHNLQ